MQFVKFLLIFLNSQELHYYIFRGEFDEKIRKNAQK